MPPLPPSPQSASWQLARIRGTPCHPHLPHPVREKQEEEEEEEEVMNESLPLTAVAITTTTITTATTITTTTTTSSPLSHLHQGFGRCPHNISRLWCSQPLKFIAH